MLKKILAREFLWLVVSLLIAVPLTFLLIAALKLVAEGDRFTEFERVLVLELTLVAYLFNFVMIYIIRLIATAVQIVAKSE